MFKIRNDERYRNYCGFLLMIAVFSIINVILIAFRINSSLYGGAFIPMIAMFYGKYYLTGGLQIVAYGGLVGFYILLMLACWWLSRRHYRYLTMGAMLYLLDIVFMFFYIMVTGFQPLWLMDILFHVILMAILIRGIYVGKHEEARKLQAENEKKEVPDDETSPIDKTDQ